MGRAGSGLVGGLVGDLGGVNLQEWSFFATMVLCEICSLVPVRISSTVLKSAASLLLGASTIFGCSVANALTLNWLTTGTGTAGSGTFNIAESGVANGGIYQITGISGTFDGSGVDTLLPPGSANTYGNNFFQYQSGSTDWLLDNSGVVFSLLDGRMIDLWSTNGLEDRTDPTGSTYAATDKVDIYTSPNGSGGFNATTTYSVASAQASTGSLSAVPGPLPILGIPAVLVYCRKLKKRIKASREASITSLV